MYLLELLYSIQLYRIVNRTIKKSTLRERRSLTQTMASPPVVATFSMAMLLLWQAAESSYVPIYGRSSSVFYNGESERTCAKLTYTWSGAKRCSGVRVFLNSRCIARYWPFACVCVASAYICTCVRSFRGALIHVSESRDTISIHSVKTTFVLQGVCRYYF